MRIHAVDFYLLRTPALPISAVHQVVQPVNDQLISLWNEGPLAEATFVASPAFYEQIDCHIKTNGWPLTPAQYQTLCKYAFRMSTRATPFGLMAGCSFGTLSKETQIEIPSAQRFIIHRRLDMDCLARLVRQLVDDPVIRPQLRFFSNNTYYKIGPEIRYVERQDEGTERHYFVSSVVASDCLLVVLERAVTGATPNQLVNQLTSHGVAPDEAVVFIDELIAQQLVVSELEPMLTGGAMLTNLRHQLSQLAGTKSVQDALRQVEQCLLSPADTRLTQAFIKQRLNDYFSDLPDHHLIQTDLFINTPKNTISQRVIQTITQQFERLLPLTQQQKNEDLTDFAQRFLDRYDRREVPLLEALDNEFGIGYGSASGVSTDVNPLLNELTFPETEAPAHVTWGAYENLLLTKFSQALREHRLGVELTDNELKSITKPDPGPLPTSIYIFGNLLGESAEGIDKGDFLFNLLAAGGPSAATLLGRFCAHSPELTEQVRTCLQREEQRHPQAIYAEIIHWPDDRLGNVLIRPALRQYEIPCLSSASVDEKYQILLSDLFVSVRIDGRVMLRSRRYGREVIPRLSTAHNYRNGIGTYRFLADLQRQDGYLGFYWNWGPLIDQPFLPRITYQNLLVSRAKWKISRDTLPTPSADIWTYLQATYQLPRWVAIAEGDNELVLDLETEIGRQLLVDDVKRKATTQVVEWIAKPDQCWLKDEQGASFVNELIIPCEMSLSGKTPASSSLQERPQVAESGRSVLSETITRSFAPGSEWLYIKLYSGTQTAEEILKTVVGPLTRQLTEEGIIDRSFFIRYADPDPHLRLRLHSLTPNFVSLVLDRLNELLAIYRQSGSVYRLQIDTYEREIERYGARLIGHSENLFAIDSQAILAYLSHEVESADRWRFAIQSCDTLLSDFGLDIFAKATLLCFLQEQFLKEHRADKSLRKELNLRFRAVEQQIIDDLCPNNCASADAYDSEARLPGTILAERSAQLRPLAHHIRTFIDTTPESGSLTDLLISYLHMSLNRLFPSQQRFHEMIIYHFMARYYQSQQALQLIRPKRQDEQIPGFVEQTTKLV